MKRLINVLVGCVLAGAAVVLGPSTAYAMELREDAPRSPFPPVKTYVLQAPKLVLEERCLPRRGPGLHHQDPGRRRDDLALRQAERREVRTHRLVLRLFRSKGRPQPPAPGP